MTASGAGAALTCQGKPVTIRGTSGDDVLSGTENDDVIFSGDGNDVVVGGAGNDTICSGPGDDIVVGDYMGDGSNTSPITASGNDEIQTGAGNDIAVGDVYILETTPPVAAHTRRITLHVCRKRLFRLIARANGDDHILTGPGDDMAAGDGWLESRIANTALRCARIIGTGDNFIRLEDGDDIGVGDVLAEFRRAKKQERRAVKQLCIQLGLCNADGRGKNEMVGYKGNDYLVGNAYATNGSAIGTGNDQATGGTGRDEMIGDSSSDLAAVGGGADHLEGNQDNDKLYGDASGSGIDDLEKAMAFKATGATAGGGPDTLVGGSENDTFVDAGPKRDECHGGPGIDRDRSKPLCEVQTGIP